MPHTRGILSAHVRRDAAAQVVRSKTQVEVTQPENQATVSDTAPLDFRNARLDKIVSPA